MTNNKIMDNCIPDGTLAAFLDGKATPSEEKMILDELSHNSELREIMDISARVDLDMTRGVYRGFEEKID